MLDIATDPSLTVDERLEKIIEQLRSLPDRGVAKALQFILTTDSAAAATYPANYLALLPDLLKEKCQAVEHIRKKKNLMIAAVNLIKEMPTDVIDRLITDYFENPSAEGMYSIIFEIATHFPSRLHKFAKRIEDKSILQAIRPGGPDTWVDEMVESYLRGADPAILKELSKFHTDKALEALLNLNSRIPDKDHEDFYMYIENSGVFPETRKASVHFKTYRGIVVQRDRSSHHMGGSFPFGVPKCPICEKTANHILTLNATELNFDLESGHNPSFFWFQCPHPAEFLFVHFKDDGIECLMDPMTDGDVGTDLIPGDLALLLVEHPNQFGRGLEAIPGFANHQVGGYPPWVRLERFPRCPLCQKGMRFLASIDSGITPLGYLAFEGILYGFWCDTCAVSATRCQND